jgi:hypothetical protein
LFGVATEQLARALRATKEWTGVFTRVHSATRSGVF